MHEDDRSTRLAVAGGILVALVVALWIGVLLLGFYYFWADEAMPTTADLVQEIMLWSAAASGATGVILIVLYIIRVFSTHSRRYHRPRVDR